ncbi:MAG TPA: sulfite exporter TauE/SafE family protein [Aggregatilineales bacterium]|jgi:uncharacterized membrane protein YfcA|nr:sulfite exporter TauE/SafE family protein [Aggregatilineales bacterium]
MQEILIFVLIGFLAQLIDGSLGMGYKVSSTAFLLNFGVPPRIASASVHTAGVLTSAVSGYSHYKFGNFDRSLIVRLAIPGIVGGVIGALLLSVIPGEVIKPIVSAYLLIMGVRIVLKALKRIGQVEAPVNTGLLGLVGGFFDATGGGGWGPIVTTTLVVNGHPPRQVIGSVNIAEWFVTLMQAATFFLAIGTTLNYNAILGLIVGGVIAAPVAAYICQRAPVQKLMLGVGLLIIVLSARTLYLSLFG